MSDKPRNIVGANKIIDSNYNNNDAAVVQDLNASTSTKSHRTVDKIELSDKSTTKSFGSKMSEQKNQSMLSSVSKGTKSDTEKGTSGPRSSSPSFLEPPLVDTKPDRLILASEEEMVDLRKHDREALKGYNAKVFVVYLLSLPVRLTLIFFN